ncbi:MAG TPA: hypothetical protein VJ349_01810 [Stellaceae bacterium]|nr:hypothetical protein [Stellaceae bacterium]
MGDNAGGAVLANLGFERRARGRELMHLAKSGKTHVVGDRRADGIRPHNLSLFV